MRTTQIYLYLYVLGTVAPYWWFVPWLAAHGLNVPLLLDELFSTRIGAFFGMDVIVSAVVLFTFMELKGGACGSGCAGLSYWPPVGSAFSSACRCFSICARANLKPKPQPPWERR